MFLMIKMQYPWAWSLQRAQRRFSVDGVMNPWSLLTM